MKRYWPLFALILVAALGALSLALNTGRSWMPLFMGFIFCQFALLKLFHPSGFAEGFQKYDLLAKAFPPHAYLYPLIELALGLAYLGGFYPLLTSSLTIALMALGSIGVIRALRKGLDLRCACMGTVLDVPLSTVTLTEDIGMGLMALFLLFS